MPHHTATGVFAKCNLEPGFTCQIQFRINVEQIKIEILFKAIHNKTKMLHFSHVKRMLRNSIEIIDAIKQMFRIFNQQSRMSVSNISDKCERCNIK